MKTGGVVLYLGVVLLQLDFKPLFKAVGIGPEKTIFESVEMLGTWPPHDAFERGHIDEAEFVRLVNKHFGKQFSV